MIEWLIPVLVFSMLCCIMCLIKFCNNNSSSKDYHLSNELPSYQTAPFQPQENHSGWGWTSYKEIGSQPAIGGGYYTYRFDL